LIVTAVGMALFAVFDVREVVHQTSESNAGLAITATLVALLHAAAAVGSAMLWRTTSASEPAAMTAA